MKAAAHSTPFSYVNAQRLPDCFVLLARGVSRWLLDPRSYLLDSRFCILSRYSAVARCGRHRRSLLPCLLEKLFYSRNRSAAGKPGFELFQNRDGTIGLI